MEDGIEDIAAEHEVALPEPPQVFEAEPVFDPGPPDVGAPHEGAAGAPPPPPVIDPVEPLAVPIDAGGGGGMVPPGQPGGAGGPDPIDIVDGPPDVGAPHEGAPQAAPPPGEPAATGTVTVPPPPPAALPVTLGTDSVIAPGQPGGPPPPTLDELDVLEDDDADELGMPIDEPEPIIRLVPAEPPEGTSLITDEALAELRLDAARGRRGQLEELIRSRDGGSAAPAAPVRTIVRVVVPEEAAAPVAGVAAPVDLPDDAHLDLDGVERLFDRMGLDTSRVDGAGLPDLLAALEDGRGVAIGATDEDGLTRALMITGIDVDRGLVFAFEPPDGDLIELPLDEVLAEWGEAGNEMLLLDEVGTDSADDGPAGDGALTRAGFAVLPITLGAGALAAAKAVRARRASS